MRRPTIADLSNQGSYLALGPARSHQAGQGLRYLMKAGSVLVAAVGAVGGLTSAGCETVRTGANPDVPAWVHRPAGVLDVWYSRRIVAAMRHRGEPYQRGRVELDIAGRRLFVGSSDGGLYALQAADGEALWRFETAGAVQSEPLFDAKENVVYFGSNDGALYKVDADTGQLHWRFATNAEVSKKPFVKDGILYFSNANDSVLAVSTDSGKLRWVQHRTPAMGMEIAGHSGVTVWRGKVYAGFSDGTVAAFDAASGEERWQPVDLAADAEMVLGQIPEYLDLDTTPIPGYVEGTPAIYVASYAGGVYALDAETGVQIWANSAVRGATSLLHWTQPEHTERGSRAMVPARSYLIAATGTSGLWALDTGSGEEIWRQRLPRGGVTAPVRFAGALLVSTSQLGLFLVSPLDGRVIDGLHMTSGTAAAPAAYGRRAFIVTNGGELLAVEIAAPGSSRELEPWPRQLL